MVNGSYGPYGTGLNHFIKVWDLGDNSRFVGHRTMWEWIILIATYLTNPNHIISFAQKSDYLNR